MQKTELTEEAAVDVAIGGTPKQRFVLAARALRTLLRDPEQTEMVFVLGLTLNASSTGPLFRQFVATETGNWLLANQPSIDSSEVDYDALRALPNNTLGREYVRFLEYGNLDPDLFDQPPGLPPMLSYIAKRMRQSHDIWHVVAGYGSDPIGEVELQAFTYAQVQLPSAALLSVAGTLRGSRFDIRTAPRTARAFRRGKRAAKFAPIIWESHWERPLNDVRAELGLLNN